MELNLFVNFTIPYDKNYFFLGREYYIDSEFEYPPAGCFKTKESYGTS